MTTGQNGQNSSKKTKKVTCKLIADKKVKIFVKNQTWIIM